MKRFCPESPAHPKSLQSHHHSDWEREPPPPEETAPDFFETPFKVPNRSPLPEGQRHAPPAPPLSLGGSLPPAPRGRGGPGTRPAAETLSSLDPGSEQPAPFPKAPPGSPGSPGSGPGEEEAEGLPLDPDTWFPLRTFANPPAQVGRGKKGSQPEGNKVNRKGGKETQLRGS